MAESRRENLAESHPLRWGEYTQDKWAKENVVVIGSGASSIQAVPGMQPHTKKLDVFVRTPPWFFAQPDNIKGETRPQGYKCENPSLLVFGYY